jgi:FKBP-type peptidyl-prolyl cis-trans isomerase
MGWISSISTVGDLRRATAMVGLLIFLLIPTGASATETLKLDQLPLGQQVTLTSGTKVTVVRAGTGDVPSTDLNLLVHYRLTMNGKVTDSSRDRIVPNPFEVNPAQPMLVPGFHAAMEGMRVGEIREAILPPDQGYGVNGNARVGVPPNTTLNFEIELVGTRKRKPETEESPGL